MPRAFGFDGDSAYHESLEAAVRASEAKKREERENAEKERRASLGLPEEGTLHPVTPRPLLPASAPVFALLEMGNLGVVLNLEPQLTESREEVME